MKYPIFEEGEVGYDLDEVLANLRDPLIKFHNLTFGTNLTYADYNNYDLSVVWDVDGLEASRRFQLFYESEFFDGVQLISGAKNFVEKLGKGPIITSRPTGLVEKTNRFVTQNLDGRISKVFFSNSWNPKLNYCLSQGIKLFVDDCLTYANEIAKAGIPVILLDFDYAYNQGATHDKVYRALSYEQALDIGRKIKLNL